LSRAQQDNAIAKIKSLGALETASGGLFNVRRFRLKLNMLKGLYEGLPEDYKRVWRNVAKKSAEKKQTVYTDTTTKISFTNKDFKDKYDRLKRGKGMQ
jgi:hypothetical protein